MSSVDGASRNPQRVRNVLRSISRNISTAAPITKIRDDIKINGLESISDETVYSYINAFKNAGGSIYQYRDNKGLECDAIIHLRDGRYALIEAKLGGSDIDTAANNLIKLKNKIDTDQMRKPSFMAVLTGTQYAYEREDGILVLPVSCLKD